MIVFCSLDNVQTKVLRFFSRILLAFSSYFIFMLRLNEVAIALSLTASIFPINNKFSIYLKEIDQLSNSSLKIDKLQHWLKLHFPLFFSKNFPWDALFGIIKAHIFIVGKKMSQTTLNVKANARYLQPPSCSFKSTSRDKKAAWGNRFVRDHNDLLYDADPYSISNRLKQSAKPRLSKAENQEDLLPMKKYQYSPIKQRQIKTSQTQRESKKGLKIQDYLNSVQKMQDMKRTYQQTAATSTKKTRFIEDNRQVQVSPFSDYQDDKAQNRKSRNFIMENINEIEEYKIQIPEKNSNLMGLSKFQFKDTIQGRLLHKSNHHLDFQRNNTHKINNLNKVWYDHSKDIDKLVDTQAESQKVNPLRNTHSFKSYSPHKLFERTKRMIEDNGCGNGGMLDKYYEITSPQKYNVNHPKLAKDNVNYTLMTARPALPKKLGTNLQYKTTQVKTMGVGDAKRPVMSMSQSERKLVISRQVISPTRGCYR